jgi:ribosome-associated protein
MDRIALRASLEAAVDFSFSRSGGPGGQNVNKVNSKVMARVSLDSLGGLSEPERARCLPLLAGRLDAAGSLYVIADEERDQPRNREIAIERLFALIVGAAAIPKARRATKPTRASRERRLSAKRVRSEVKRGRQGEGGD